MADRQLSIPQALEKRSLALELAVRLATSTASTNGQAIDHDAVITCAEKFFAFVCADAGKQPATLLADSVPFNKDA